MVDKISGSTQSQPLPTQQWEQYPTLRKGRYRLLNALPLPENQRDQGRAWLAVDSLSRDRHRIVIREVRGPLYDLAAQRAESIQTVIARQKQLGQHPGLAHVLDAFTEDDMNYLVFEAPTGETLATIVKQQGGALSERDVAEYGRQLCEILAFFSRQAPPFVHGAISTETIVVHPDHHTVSLTSLPLFPPRGPSGTPYDAPEQRQGTISPASDLYAVAATLHHLVTGYDPRERINSFYPPARRLNPKVTPRMEAILAKQLHLSVAERYARPSEMQADLSSLLASYPPRDTEASDTRLPPPKELQLSATQMRAWSRSRSLTSVVILGVVSLVLLLGLFTPMLLPRLAKPPATPQSDKALQARLLQQQQHAALQAEQRLEQGSYTSKNIGLSDGRFVFDTYTGRSDTQLKQQAAQALQRGDVANAVNVLTQAVTSDPTDGEAQIYNENVHILQSGAPSLTIVLGLAFDNNAVDLLPARSDTESAFLIQHEVNTANLLPHGLKLRLLIASSGADHANVATVAQMIATRVTKTGNPDHIIGVAGWPFSSQTINARDTIASAGIPLVSQTASSVKLSGSSPYFFRVNPPDDQQGQTLGKVAVQQLQAQTILVLRDPEEPYSVSLADSFTASAKALGATVINNPADYFTTSQTTVATFESTVNDALANGANLIFLAGFNVDAVRLAHALGNQRRAHPLNRLLGQLNILGGDELATPLVLGQGNGPDAQLAATYPQDMRHILCTTFGDPDEWTYLHIPSNEQPPFFGDWMKTYESSGIASNNAPPPNNDAILTADAVGVIVRAATLAHGLTTGQAVRDALASLGQGGVPPFQGISGRIFFNTQGNPVDKALVVVDVEQDPNGNNVIKLKQVAGVFR